VVPRAVRHQQQRVIEEEAEGVTGRDMIRSRVRIRDSENFWKYTPKTNGMYGFPSIQRCSNINIESIFPIIQQVKPSNGVIPHFYIDDFQFSRFWSNPHKYIELLKKYDAVIGPDFSVYSDMPLAMIIYNIYRNNWLSNYWSSHGVNIIPNITWPIDKFEDFMIDGQPKKSIISISNVGLDKYEMIIFENELNRIIDILDPELIILHGKKISIKCEHKHFESFSIRNKIK
jgi:hypothetical protein